MCQNSKPLIDISSVYKELKHLKTIAFTVFCYLREGGYVLTGFLLLQNLLISKYVGQSVCLFVCMFVSMF